MRRWSDGWEAGAWPYNILAVARTRDSHEELSGYGTYVEGDTFTHWFRCQDDSFDAITAEVFFHWASGQSDGPDNLPAAAADLAVSRTVSPTPAGRTKSSQGVPATKGRDTGAGHTETR